MFRQARFQLTAWYLLIIMVISLAFSAFIYQMLTAEVQRFARVQRFRIERRFIGGSDFPFNPLTPLPQNDIDLVNEVDHRIILNLLIINSVVLLTSGGLGYILAGRTLKPISQMLDEQNRFVSDASHELRTPLTSLKSVMEVNLRDKHLNLKDAKLVIRESIDEVDKLQSLSDHLLQIAQYQKPQAALVCEPTQLNQCLNEAVNRVLPIAKQRNIEIKHLGEELIVLGNRFQLVDLFTIILENAIKYSHSNKIIKVSAVKSDHQAVTKIIDRGIGIDARDIPRIFDRFFRSDSARTKTDAGGYGLGLSIAKNIVNQHRGHISVESQLGKGSTFIIRLPLN